MTERSFKTRRLLELLPDVYAADDPEALVHKLLDAAGAELMRADAAVKRLVKSHWIDYAEGAALDGLGAIFKVTRRRLPGGEPEPDDAFRRRLESTVPFFTGGGTVRAVIGAVRSALGLPFHLDQLGLPEGHPLLADLEKLVTIEEFSPRPERLVGSSAPAGDTARLDLAIDLSTVAEDLPRVEWSFQLGAGRRLVMERLGSGLGVRSRDAFLVPRNQRLLLEGEADGRLRAHLGSDDVSGFFVNLDGSGPAAMPPVPRRPSTWRFTARGATHGVSVFDEGDAFDPPDFEVEMRWRQFQPLTFDVHVPYFLGEAARELRTRHGYGGRLFFFEGLPRERMQEVVDQTRAAGVRGNVHFTLGFFEPHDVADTLRIDGEHRAAEDAAARDRLDLGSFQHDREDHAMAERFAVGAQFDFSTFDTDHAFQEESG